jgi:hypothetical protein
MEGRFLSVQREFWSENREQPSLAASCLRNYGIHVRAFQPGFFYLPAGFSNECVKFRHGRLGARFEDHHIFVAHHDKLRAKLQVEPSVYILRDNDLSPGSHFCGCQVCHFNPPEYILTGKILSVSDSIFQAGNWVSAKSCICC